jgi:Ca2+-binding RTX toxin-like protein
MTILGTGGDDNLTGTSGNDTFDMTQGGNDTVSGLAGDDHFIFGSTFTADDKIDGGDGHDTLELNGDYTGGNAVTFDADTMVNIETMTLGTGHSYTFTMNDGNVGVGQTLLVDGSALGASDVLTFDGSLETDGAFRIVGGAGNDHLIGGDVRNVFNLSLGGNDTVIGRQGLDIFRFGAAYNSSDSVDGGAGAFDRLSLAGDYTGANALVLDAASIVGVERIRLGAGFSYDLTLNDNTGFNHINAHNLLAGDSLTLNYDNVSGHGISVTGGAGNDTITVTAGENRFNLSMGGDDTVNAGSGDDLFRMGSALTAADRLDGGDGHDRLTLTGDYSAGLVLGADTVLNVERFGLRLGDFNLTTNDATVAAGQTLTINAIGANHLVFDGSAETDGHFHIMASAGDDTITGGALSDVFNLSAGGNDIVNGGGGDDLFVLGAGLTTADRIDGGDGRDVLVLDGDYSAGLFFSSTTIANIEKLEFRDGFDYSIATDDANVAANQTLVVDARSLSADHGLSFDGSAESDGHFYFMSGNGADHFQGGALADTFDYRSIALSSDTRDTITGFDFAGGDTIRFQNVREAAVNSDASISSGSFDADISAACGSHHSQHWAELITATSGDLAGHVFLVVSNGTHSGGYIDGGDLIIELDGAQNLASFDINDFTG